MGFDDTDHFPKRESTHKSCAAEPLNDRLRLVLLVWHRAEVIPAPGAPRPEPGDLGRAWPYCVVRSCSGSRTSTRPTCSSRISGIVPRCRTRCRRIEPVTNKSKEVFSSRFPGNHSHNVEQVHRKRRLASDAGGFLRSPKRFITWYAARPKGTSFQGWLRSVKNDKTVSFQQYLQRAWREEEGCWGGVIRRQWRPAIRAIGDSQSPVVIYEYSPRL